MTDPTRTAPDPGSAGQPVTCDDGKDGHEATASLMAEPYLPAGPARHHHQVHHVADEIPLSDLPCLPHGDRASVTALLDQLVPGTNAAGGPTATLTLTDPRRPAVRVQVEVSPAAWAKYRHHLPVGWIVFAEVRVWHEPGRPPRVMLMTALCDRGPDFQTAAHAIEADRRGGVQP